MRKAEAHLDAFWEAVDKHYKAKGIGKSRHDLVAQLFSSDRAIQRTPEWVKSEQAKTPLEKTDMCTNRSQQYFTTP